MGGFENGDKKGMTIIQNAPNFKDDLAKYTAQVEDIGVQIKAGQAELADLQVQLVQAKTDLQAQYDKRVGDLGNQISVLTQQLADLTLKSSALDTQIEDKQAILNNISLDNTAKQALLDSAWADFHKASADYVVAKKQLDDDVATLANLQAQFNTDKAVFETTKTAALADLAKQKADADASVDAANKAKADALATLNAANDALSSLEAKQADLALKTQNAQVILDGADAVQKQADQNKIDAANNSAQALQNQSDINEIKVARIAIHNREQDVAAREETVTQAETKIINGAGA